MAQKPSPPPTLNIPSAVAGDIYNPKLALASGYEMESVSVTLASPAYSLPLALEEIGNLSDVDLNLQLKGNQKEFL